MPIPCVHCVSQEAMGKKGNVDVLGSPASHRGREEARPVGGVVCCMPGTLLEKQFVTMKKNRDINSKIVVLDICCHNLKIVASYGNK